jgi:hypothetical protein
VAAAPAVVTVPAVVAAVANTLSSAPIVSEPADNSSSTSKPELVMGSIYMDYCDEEDDAELLAAFEGGSGGSSSFSTLQASNTDLSHLFLVCTKNTHFVQLPLQIY